MSTSSVIDVDGNGEVSLISEDLKRNASLANKDWKSIGQVEIPRSTIRDVAGNNFASLSFPWPCGCGSQNFKLRAKFFLPIKTNFPAHDIHA